MNEGSVLAANFVPESLRCVHFQPAAIFGVPSVDEAAECGEIWEHLVPSMKFQNIAVSVPQTRELGVAFQERELYQGLYPQHPGQSPSRGESILTKGVPSQDVQEYVKFWEEVVSLERVEQLFLVERYAQYKTFAKVMQHSLGVDSQGVRPKAVYSMELSISGIADTQPPLQPGDTLLLRFPTQAALASPQGIPTSLVEIRTRVQSISRTNSGLVVAEWLEAHVWHFLKDNTAGFPRMHDDKLNCNCSVRFVPSPAPYVAILTALDWVVQRPAIRTLLFPEAAPNVPQSTLLNPLKMTFDQDLSVHQVQFCSIVLRRTAHPTTDAVRPPMVLTGSAGTGKTKALLRTVQRLLITSEKHRILLCTPSHTAADMLTRRLAALAPDAGLLRVLPATRSIATVPAEIIPHCCQKADTGTFTLPGASQLLQKRVVICTCLDAHLLYKAGVTNEQLRVRRRAFQEAFASAMEGSNLTGTLEGVDETHWTHLFIDEAAQATEPETLVPLSVVVDLEPGSVKVEIALVGDPRQLSPSVFSDEALKAGLGRSWIERLLLRQISALGGGRAHMLGPEMVQIQDWIEDSFRENLSTFLTLNYRGHPSFLMMPSALFYFDKIHSAYTHKNAPNGKIWSSILRKVESQSTMVDFVVKDGLSLSDVPAITYPTKQADWPIHCRSIYGIDKSAAVEYAYTSNSWSNAEEAYEVISIVKELAADGLSTASIGVMAPFRGQVVLIRKLLRAANLGGVNVGIVEDYQSVERDVIILSLTRASPAFVEKDIEQRIGCFGQIKRTNVALTRAEHMLIVVGNPSVMVRDFVWRQFLYFCLRNGLCYGSLDAVADQVAFGPSHTIVNTSSSRESTIDLVGSDDLIVVSSLERSWKAKHPSNCARRN